MLSPRRKREIARAAQLLLSSHSVDMSRQVDVFGLVQEVGLVLRFMPLERLLGAFVPGEPGGILLNSKRPVALQRFTAAHEVGHWNLHLTEFSLDGELEVDGRTPDSLELEAQLFASYLLMPLPLISRAARDTGLSRGVAPTGDQIYTIAGTMGVSFAAAIVHLENLNLVTRNHAIGLRKVKPVNVQVGRTFGEKLISADAHVWSQDEVQGGHAPDIYVGDIVAIDLPENRTTGYRWFVSAPAPETLDIATETGSIEDEVFGDDEASEADGSFEEDEDPVEGPAIAFDSFRVEGIPTSANQLTSGSADGLVISGNGGRRRLLIRASRDGSWRATLSYAPVQRPADAVETTVLEGNSHLRPAVQQRRAIVNSYRLRTNAEQTE